MFFICLFFNDYIISIENNPLYPFLPCVFISQVKQQYQRTNRIISIKRLHTHTEKARATGFSGGIRLPRCMYTNPYGGTNRLHEMKRKKQRDEKVAHTGTCTEWERRTCTRTVALHAFKTGTRPVNHVVEPRLGSLRCNSTERTLRATAATWFSRQNYAAATRRANLWMGEAYWQIARR